MDEKTRKNRLWHMRRLVSVSGGANAAADIMKRSPAYITAIAGPNPQRSIGNKMAVVIEQAFGIAPGSLDIAPPKQVENKDTLIAQIAEVLANTSSEDKEFVLAVANWVVGRSLRSRTEAGK